MIGPAPDCLECKHFDHEGKRDGLSVMDSPDAILTVRKHILPIGNDRKFGMSG